MLPLGVSAVTVGFGFLIALDSPPLDLRSSPLLIPIAQAMVTIPLVVRMVLPVLRAADDRLRQAAAVLGAGPIRVWWSVSTCRSCPGRWPAPARSPSPSRSASSARPPSSPGRRRRRCRW